MIERLQVSNYRSLGSEVSIELGQFTVLVGQNGAGKSNIVDALRFLADCMHIGLEAAINKRQGIGALRHWSAGNPPLPISLAVEIRGEPDFSARYGFTLLGAHRDEYEVAREHAEVREGPGSNSPPNKGTETSQPRATDRATKATTDRATETHRFEIREGNWLSGPSDLRPKVGQRNLALPLISGDERFGQLADVLSNIATYSMFPDTLRVPQRYNPTRPMHEHGDNWLSILDDQPGPSRAELIAALGQLTGDIEDIRVTKAAGYWLVEFRHGAPGHNRPAWFGAVQESDGTLRFAGIVTALLQEPPVPIICIEEPELTMHPDALPLLYDFLAQASGRSQIILSTHSPDLLDLFDVETVRVVERIDGQTMVAPMNAEQRQTVKSGLMTLGEVWRREGLQPALSAVKE